jgi:hypothetical protein
MARTHTFKGSASAGYGYFAYIEDGQLVIGEDWGREGGILYKGPYQHAQVVMSRLRANAPKLANSIDKYYFDEAEKLKKISNVPVKKGTITHQFKDSRDSFGYGYYGYIENGQLVLCNEQPREGGVYFRGSYQEAVAKGHMNSLKAEDPRLFSAIETHFSKHGVSDESDRKDLCDSKTRIYIVKLMMNNGKELDAVISGESETDVIRKILPPVPNTVMMYDLEGRTMAVRSDKIYTVAIID